MGDTLSQSSERIIATLRLEIENLKRDFRGASKYPTSKRLGFWAKITAATNVANNRWKYSWTEIQWTITASKLAYTTPAGAKVGPYTVTGVGSTGWAWNSTEMDNTAILGGSGWEDQTLALAPNLTIAALQPIGTTQKGGTKFPIVFLRRLKLVTVLDHAYLFAGWNTPGMSTGGS